MVRSWVSDCVCYKCVTMCVTDCSIVNTPSPFHSSYSSFILLFLFSFLFSCLVLHALSISLSSPLTHLLFFLLNFRPIQDTCYKSIAFTQTAAGAPFPSAFLSAGAPFIKRLVMNTNTWYFPYRRRRGLLLALWMFCISCSGLRGEISSMEVVILHASGIPGSGPRIMF